MLDFQSINWAEVLPCNDTLVNVNDIFQSFYSHVSGIIDKHVPIRKLTRKEIKSLPKPWITKSIRVSIKMKDIFYKKYLASKSQYYLIKYKSYRNQISHLLRVAKQNYYQNYFTVNSKNIKKYLALYKGINFSQA